MRPQCRCHVFTKGQLSLRVTYGVVLAADLRPAVSAPLVQKYLDANGIILGKTNLGELQSGGSTNPNNEEYGINTALNPYNPVITPSGES